MASQATEHHFLKLRLESRRVLSRRNETERENPLGVHVGEPGTDDLVRHAYFLHLAKVAKQSQCAQLLLTDQPFECLSLVGSCGQSDFPSVRGFQLLERLVSLQDREPTL